MELGNLLYILICFFVPAIYLPTTDFIGIGDADLRINFVSPGNKLNFLDLNKIETGAQISVPTTAQIDR